MTTQSYTSTVTMDRELPLTLTEAGQGRTALTLHGGGGPRTVASIATHLASTMHTVTLTNPGWEGTPRPSQLSSIEDLARLYLRFLDTQDLHNVVVIGSSIGGWIGAEMAVRNDSGRVAGLVLIDAVGIEVPGAPIRDFFALDARGVAEYSFYDAQRYYVDPASVPAEQKQRQQQNMATMRVYAGDPYMHNPGLLPLLGQVHIPTLVLWGEADRIVTPTYGEALAQAIPDAQFALIERAGHPPQIEQPEATFRRLDDFLHQTLTIDPA